MPVQIPTHSGLRPVAHHVMTHDDVLQVLISGAIVMGYGVCGLFFLRFWRTTRDRLFAIFSAAFWVLGVHASDTRADRAGRRVAYGAVRAPTFSGSC